MYRVLAAAHEVRERRAQARHPAYAAPELVATGPNQVWSWDITKLKGPVPYLYYYVILDLFSRYVVGWMVARHENAHLAERLLAAYHAAPTHHSRGPRCAHAQHTRCAALLGPGYHRQSFVSNGSPKRSGPNTEFPARFGALEHARGVSPTCLRGTTTRTITAA